MRHVCLGRCLGPVLFGRGLITFVEKLLFVWVHHLLPLHGVNCSFYFRKALLFHLDGFYLVQVLVILLVRNLIPRLVLKLARIRNVIKLFNIYLLLSLGRSSVSIKALQYLFGILYQYVMSLYLNSLGQLRYEI